MVTKTEGRHAGEFLMTEGESNYSREAITILSGAGKLVAGTVLGKVAVGAASSAAKSGGNTGNGALTLDGTTPVLAGAKSGVYTVRCITAATNGGTFRVESPAGDVIGDVAVGATFADDIKFSIADGASDFIVGDGFDITVAVGSGKYVASPETGANGSEAAVAVLLDEVDATSADAAGVAIVRFAQVNGKKLAYHSTVDDATKKGVKNAQLVAAGILVR